MFKSGYGAIVGRPNAGKSTLLNGILQSQLSIVTPKPQTTRDQVLGFYTEPDKGQIVFVDTPGIHRAHKGGLNEYMVAQAKQALEAPDVIWYLVDPFSKIEHEQVVLEELKRASRVPIFVLFNKLDKVEALGRKDPTIWSTLDQFELQLREKLAQAGLEVKLCARISAAKDKGVQELLEKTWDLLPEGQPYYPDFEQISDRPVRYFVSEKIREKLFTFLGDEIPYSCAVSIEKFDEKSVPMRIEAQILVERESQKGIVIGSQGKKIKEIGQAARQDIEKFLGGGKIFLGLKVKELRQWTQSPEGLQRAGYQSGRDQGRHWGRKRPRQQ